MCVWLLLLRRCRVCVAAAAHMSCVCGCCCTDVMCVCGCCWSDVMCVAAAARCATPLAHTHAPWVQLCSRLRPQGVRHARSAGGDRAGCASVTTGTVVVTVAHMSARTCVPAHVRPHVWAELGVEKGGGRREGWSAGLPCWRSGADVRRWRGLCG